jgi:L,D-transpeptidase catalytic domain
MPYRPLKRKQTRWLRRTYFAVAALTALMATVDNVIARSSGAEESVQSRTPGEPIMAIVSLRNQRITVYDADGWILRAPVSSGQKGRETPAGIFSVIQKEAEHYSNLYDDAFMPHMQRITWSGIALHGGVLPGYPASHGCVRMPFEFAERLFDVTRVGLRVIVAPTDVAPAKITHPVLFQAKRGAGALAAARITEADEAAKKADQARLAAGAAYREVTRAMMPVRMAENLRLRTEKELLAAETALGTAVSVEAKEQAEGAKARALVKIAELKEQWAAAKADLQPKLDALTAAREAVTVAETARARAAEVAREAARELEPASILISRKTQRLYIRQAYEAIFDGPVTILDPDRPIGTHVFTAMERTSGDANIRWNVVSLRGEGLNDDSTEPRGLLLRGEPMPTEPTNVKAVLDRIVIPQDVLDRIPGIVPRSSLIITDEALSTETGKGTEFVVLLSGEPQGGIKFRRPVQQPTSRARAISRPIGAGLSEGRSLPGETVFMHKPAAVFLPQAI